MPHVMPMHEGRELPTITFRQIDLPEIMRWEVNGRYFLVMAVEMKSKHNPPFTDSPVDEHKLEGTFEIKSVRALDHTPVNAAAIEKMDLDATAAAVRSGNL